MNLLRTSRVSWYGLILTIILCGALLTLVNPAQTAETAAPKAVKSNFSDVASTDVNAIYINYLVGRGIITGYPDGGYHPEEGLTRAQAATVIVKAAGLSVDPTLTNPFSDVSDNHWAKAYITKAAQAKYISGMPDGSYHPDEQLTRAQAISLILRLSQQTLTGTKLPALTDIDSNHWAAPSVAVGLASGMVGLSADSKQYLPDSPFNRISLAHALGVLLTQDPGLYATPLEGILITRKGSVTIQSAGSLSVMEVKTETIVKTGDIIKTGVNSSAELNYPDGSSMLLEENTQITVAESKGRKYIKTDGSEGTAVEWLDIKLKQGTMLGGLATKQSSGSEKNKTTGQVYQIGSQLIASLDGWKLLAAEGQELPWYVASQQKKVKIKVDMPWGVASIRGTFVGITVSPSGQSTVGCLTGDAEVTNGGVTVPLNGNQQTGISGANTPPPSTTVLGRELAALFQQANSWLQTTAQQMDLNQEVLLTQAPGAVQSTLDVINQALLNTGTITPPVSPVTSSGSGGAGSGDSDATTSTDLDLASVSINVASELITNTTTAMEYSLDSTNGTDGNWDICTDTNTSVSFAPGDVLWVREAGNNSNNQYLDQINQPAVPNSEVTFDVAAGEIYGLGDTYEYSLSGGDYTSAPVVSFVAGPVEVRAKATATTLPSEPEQIGSISPAANPPNISLSESTFAGADIATDGTLEYQRITGGTWTPIISTTVDTTGAEFIIVRVKATSAALPSLATDNLCGDEEAVVNWSGVSINVADGKLTGTTEQMQYHLPGGGEWATAGSPNTLGLTFSPGIVMLREIDNPQNMHELIHLYHRNAPHFSEAKFSSEDPSEATLTVLPDSDNPEYDGDSLEYCVDMPGHHFLSSSWANLTVSGTTATINLPGESFTHHTEVRVRYKATEDYLASHWREHHMERED
ncbi:MAG: hypothetical protein CVU90_13720 [Firmicutes bacterium HGW-Firmicutes-15]|nr:MAG: hypothetical protein CVU90_13720 [Firmicutes bacterium HGW-Firmicutes-15]